MLIKNLLKAFHIRPGIKSKLLASFIVVIIIPVLIGAFYPYTYTERIIIREADESLRLSLDSIVDSIKYKMVKYIRLSNKLMDNIDIKKLFIYDYSDKIEEAGFAVSYIHENIVKMEITNNDEEIVNIRIYKQNDTLPEYGDFLLDESTVQGASWYKEVYENKGVSYWKDGVFKPFIYKDIPTISIISRINLPYPVGLLEIELRQEVIFDSIYKFRYKDNSLIGVINQNGKLVAGNTAGGGQLDRLMPYMGDRALNSAEESFTCDVEGEEYLILNKELNFQGWRIVAAIPVRELYSNTRVIKLVTLVTSVSCIIVFFVVTLFLSDVLTSRIQKLTKAMVRVESGDFNVSMAVSGDDEISELSRGFNSMTVSIKNLIEEVYKTGIEKKEAELKALQEQINPHFLYNTLSSINWLAIEAGAPRIIDLVEALATFYRLSLNKGKEIILLKDEITQAKAYVKIQKIRYEDSFEVNFGVDPAVENARIIKFIIQPFIENAIIHGFGEKEKGSMYITAGPYGEKSIIIRVIDNGKGMDHKILAEITGGAGANGKRGYGIKNVDERIKLHYGPEYGVNILSEEDSGTVVEIVLPFDSGAMEGTVC